MYYLRTEYYLFMVSSTIGIIRAMNLIEIIFFLIRTWCGIYYIYRHYYILVINTYALKVWYNNIVRIKQEPPVSPTKRATPLYCIQISVCVCDTNLASRCLDETSSHETRIWMGRKFDLFVLPLLAICKIIGIYFAMWFH